VWVSELAGDAWVVDSGGSLFRHVGTSWVMQSPLLSVTYVRGGSSTDVTVSTFSKVSHFDGATWNLETGEVPPGAFLAAAPGEALLVGATGNASSCDGSTCTIVPTLTTHDLEGAWIGEAHKHSFVVGSNGTILY
jgi:hypothetical protein